MNQPIKEVLPTPTGWLVAPTVYTQLWHCTEEGIPIRLKTTKGLAYQAAHKTWHELLSNDWELIKHQIK